MILPIIASSNPQVPTVEDVPQPVKVIDIGDIAATSVYWFRAYPTSLYPMMDWSGAKYFFPLSTDHDSGDGGIWYFTSDSPDPRHASFTEIGLIFNGFQAETPCPLPIDGKFCLFYHTSDADPSNGGIQQTRLRTATSGTLLSATWTQQTNPLGSEFGDAHTGYFRAWIQENGVYKGTHFKIGSNLPTTLPTMQYSTLSSDGLTGTRINTVNLQNCIPEGYYWSPSFGEFFKLYDRWWWLGTINNETTGGAGAKLAIFEANSNFELVRLLSVLNQDDPTSYQRSTWHVYPDLDSKIAHCYLNNKIVGIWYTTFNLAQLQFQ